MFGEHTERAMARNVDEAGVAGSAPIATSVMFCATEDVRLAPVLSDSPSKKLSTQEQLFSKDPGHPKGLATPRDPDRVEASGAGGPGRHPFRKDSWPP